MFAPKGFSSFSDYLKFSLAGTYVRVNSREPFAYPDDTLYLERVGSVLSSALTSPLHFVINNLYNPVFVTGFTFAAMGVTTLIYYPKQFHVFLEKFIPQMKHINPLTVKAALFGFLELTFFGLGVRAYGRLQNPKLLSAWKNKEIVAIPIGSSIAPRR